MSNEKVLLIEDGDEVINVPHEIQQSGAKLNHPGSANITNSNQAQNSKKGCDWDYCLAETW